ncbi:MAG: hypothetical protein R2939_09045 [Kofleriaceae bacterium]
MSAHAGVAAALAALLVGCRRPAPVDPGPARQIIGETTAARLGDPAPRTSAFFDGQVVRVALARGEGRALQVLAAGARRLEVALAGDGVTVRRYRAAPARVSRPSTTMYGGSRGAGAYADRLVDPDDAAVGPWVIDLDVALDAAPGPRRGTLTLDDATIPLEVTVGAVRLPPRAEPAWIWAYYDARELAAAAGVAPGSAAAIAAEDACAASFRRHGVVASPELTLADAERRLPMVRGLRYVPVLLPTERAEVEAAVRGWRARLAGTGQIAFAIPVDEPRTPEAWARARELGGWVRGAGGGPGEFLLAITAVPEAATDPIDVYISPGVMRRDRAPGPPLSWTYNGRPPQAGSMVVDAAAGALRSWGAIAWRWQVPLWYVWDALYWHDRHNRKRRGEAPLAGAALAGASLRDAVTFDDGEDHGNLDGALAYPAADGVGCAPSLRLLQLRRAVDDRALLDAAARCAGVEVVDALAAELVPSALADAGDRGAGAWPADEPAWEAWRERVVELAAPCAPAEATPALDAALGDHS